MNFLFFLDMVVVYIIFILEIEFLVGDHVFVLWNLYLICEGYIISKVDNDYYEVKYTDTTEIELVYKEFIYEYVDYLKVDENDSRCLLCLQYDITDESGSIVFCDKCNVSVHTVYNIYLELYWIGFK